MTISPRARQFCLRLTVLLGLGVSTLPAQAEPPAATLKAAVERAVLENPEVLAGWHRFLAAGEEKNAASGDYLPQVDLTGGYGDERRERPDFTAVREYERHGAALNVRQLLFDGFATSETVARLSHEERARYFDLIALSEQTALEAVRAYTDVLRFRRLNEYAEANFQSHQTIYRQLESRAAAGVSKGVDLEQAAGRLALARSNVLTESGNLADVSARYRRIVGEAPAETLEVPASFEHQALDDQAYAQMDLSQAPAMLAALESTASARAGQAAAKSGYYPSLELRARQDLTENLDGIPGESDTGVVEVVVNYNLFKGGADSARVRQAAHLVGFAQDLRDKTCRDLGQTLSIAQNDAQKLKQQHEYLAQHELSTRKVRDAYRQQFDLGQRSLLDLLDTENELFSARRTLTNAEFDLELARSRLLAPVGRLLPALGLTGLARQAPEGEAAEADVSGCYDRQTDGLSLR